MQQQGRGVSRVLCPAPFPHPPSFRLLTDVLVDYNVFFSSLTLLRRPMWIKTGSS